MKNYLSSFSYDSKGDATKISLENNNSHLLKFSTLINDLLEYDSESRLCSNALLNKYFHHNISGITPVSEFINNCNYSFLQLSTNNIKLLEGKDVKSTFLASFM